MGKAIKRLTPSVHEDVLNSLRSSKTKIHASGSSKYASVLYEKRIFVDTLWSYRIYSAKFEWRYFHTVVVYVILGIILSGSKPLHILCTF